MSSAIIIGGGVGGLFTGAILSKEGVKVTVIEKNPTLGGGLQSFKRFGTLFDTGMHVIGGMQPGGNVRRICEYLGILDEVKIKDVDDNCTDRLYFAQDKAYYEIAKGKQGFVDSLSRYFPSERDGIARYVKAIYDITDSLDLFYLRPSNDMLTVHGDSFAMPAHEFIATFVEDPRLRSVMAYMNPLYGGRVDETPAFIHAIINVLYIDGASRFVGGSQAFAQTLAGVILGHGGEIVTGDAVTSIEVQDRHITCVKTRSGRTWQADRYISAIHPCAMLSLMGEGGLPRSYRNRLEAIPNSYSAFSLYIKLKPNSFPYLNFSEYYMSRYDEIWNFGRTDKPWPLGFLIMTPPEDNQDEYSEKVLVTAPMAFDEVLKWENTTVGHRGPDYEVWKEEMTERLLDMVEEMHPNFRSCIEAINSASPLTIRDFYAAKGGCLSGYSKDHKNLALSQVPVVTKVDNLLLTGQCNNLHGFCGVALTAITTSEVILGRNYVLNKINEVAP